MFSSQQLRPGYRRNSWVKNCLALGEAANGSGQLGVSNLHLVHSGILRFIELFPSVESPAFAQAYNGLPHWNMSELLPLQHLPFALSQRAVPGFWHASKTLVLPDELNHSINLFKQRGNIASYEQETFSPSAWAAPVSR